MVIEWLISHWVLSSLLLASVIVFVVMCGVICLRWNSRRQFGKLILKVEQASPYLDLVLGFISGALFLVFFARFLTTLALAQNYIFIVCSVPALVFTHRGFMKMEIREVGIFSGIGMWRWEEIDSYHWDARRHTALRLRLHKGVFKTITLSIQPDCKDMVDSLLHEYVQS